MLHRHGVPELGAIQAFDRAAIAKNCRVAGSYDHVLVPTFNTAGWYDIFLQGTLDNYVAMSARGREARLIIGPWAHERFTDPIGQRAFGIHAARDGARVHPHGDWNDFQLAWFRRQLEDDERTELPEDPVRIFVMGRNEWRDEAAWPLERASTQRWYLYPPGDLSPRPPGANEPVSGFVYDPRDPVPTMGGHTLLWPEYPAGAFDQRPIEARDDVLTFGSEPLEADLEVTGRIRIVLHAQSTAPSTDWVGRLCDVFPDGRSLNLCDGIVRVTGHAQRRERYEIDLWSTSNVFLAGHRLRVHVTSSSFPRWDRNLNTGNQRDARIQAAHQTIHHSSDGPSYIELPVVDQ
jgi:putative CocE/NonD family hydrolase